MLEDPHLIRASLITDLGEFLTFAHQQRGWRHNAMALHISNMSTSGLMALFFESCNTIKGCLTFVEYVLCVRISSRHAVTEPRKAAHYD